jgi:hypothetical protein
MRGTNIMTRYYIKKHDVDLEEVTTDFEEDFVILRVAPDNKTNVSWELKFRVEDFGLAVMAFHDAEREEDKDKRRKQREANKQQ